MTGTDHLSTPEVVAAKLANEPVLRMSKVGGGRNSRVLRVETTNHVFALKQYPSLQDDPRNRLGVETRALKWMEKQGLDRVPRVIATDISNNCALLSWVEGKPVRDVIGADIDQAVDFLAALRDLHTSEFPMDHLAAEACLSGAEIERQLRKRVAALNEFKDEPQLRAFLVEEFSGVLEDQLRVARRVFSTASLSFDAELEQPYRCLVPSDFGFHNALKDENGRLTFIDFEYFGWDDPVKLIADILLHPGTHVEVELRARFRTAAERLYCKDPQFIARLRAFYPLFALRWALILLNEFHPERWRRRVLAGAVDDWEESKSRQLRAARDMLAISRAQGGLR